MRYFSPSHFVLKPRRSIFAFSMPLAIAIVSQFIAPLNSRCHAQGERKPRASQQELVGRTTLSNSVIGAQNQAFSILELVLETKEIEAPSSVDMMAMAPSALDKWLFARYRSAFNDTGKRYDSRAIAGFIHQDLQFTRWSLERGDIHQIRTGLRVAVIATLYAGLLPDDPRLVAAIHEGFLLPGAKFAPADGLAAKNTIYEGAANSFRVVGRTDRWLFVLRQLLDLQTAKQDVSGADMARIHLSSALVSEANSSVSGSKELRVLANAIKAYDEAIMLLGRVSTTDLSGAKKPLARWVEIRDRWQAQLLAGLPVNNPNPTAGNIGETDKDQGNTNKEQADAEKTVSRNAPSPALLGIIGGRDGNTGNTGLKEVATTSDEIPEELAAEMNVVKDGAPLTKLEQAIIAARVADRISRRANEALTVSLARLLDAQDAQRALNEAQGKATDTAAAPVGGLPRNRTIRPVGGVAKLSNAELDQLKQEALTTKRLASEAAERATALLKSAQVTSARATLLAVMAHSTSGGNLTVENANGNITEPTEPLAISSAVPPVTGEPGKANPIKPMAPIAAFPTVVIPNVLTPTP